MANALEAEIRRRIREGLVADLPLDGTEEEEGAADGFADSTVDDQLLVTPDAR